MESQSFLSKILSYISPDMDLALLIVCFIMAGFGYAIIHGAKINKKIKVNETKFSFKYWFYDNIVPILMFVGIVFAYIRFTEYIVELIKANNPDAFYVKFLNIIVGSKIFLSFIIGLFYDKIGAKFIRKLVRKISKKGGLK